MRTTLICLAALLVAFVGYAYATDPAGCKKVLHDIAAVVLDVTPVSLHLNGTSQASTSTREKTNSDLSPQAPVVIAPTPTPTAASVISIPPAPPPPPAWAPPAVMPSQPNWTWTTLDGTAYQNVVVTKIEPETVSITHSMGVAHIPINLLPSDIQKQLNYDPVVAAAARAESERELAHPYYTMATRTDAQTAAQQMHWPLAWVSSRQQDIASTNPMQDDEISLTLLALNYLKNKSIIIFINAESEMPQTPAIVHHQFSALDDGVLAGNANYMPPKVVFSTPDASKIFGRVSFTQMKAGRESAIDAVLATIPMGPEAPAPSSEQTAGASATASSPPTNAPVPSPSPGAPPKP